MRHFTEQRVKWMSQLMVRCYQRKSVIICLAVGGGLTLPFTGFSNVSDSIEDLSNGSVVMLADLERIQKEKVSARLSGMNTWCAAGRLLLVNHDDFPPQLLPDVPSKKTGSALVGSVMALLATFEAANVLPPEGTAPANQLIHGLIQMQSALVKSQNLELNEYVALAVDHRFEMESAALLQTIHRSGLTSKILEALVIYDKQLPMWEQPALGQIFQRYNVSRSDWLLIEHIFAKADATYRTKGSSIHKIFEQWRSQLAGGR